MAGAVLEERHRGVYRVFARQLGATIRAARAERGLSQEQTAVRAGIAVKTYRRLERGGTSSGGKSNPTLDTTLRVLVVLELHPSELTRRCSEVKGASTQPDPGALRDAVERPDRHRILQEENDGPLDDRSYASMRLHGGPGAELRP